MRFKLSRPMLRLALGFFATPLLGCAIATDLINPSLLESLGLDPATIIPQQGRVLVVYNNDTNFNASFVSFASPDASNPAANADDILSEDLGPGEARTLAVDCPVGQFTPVAAVVFTDTEAAEVPYAGTELISGLDFSCGDVIEVSLVQFAAGVAMQVRVIPGR